MYKSETRNEEASNLLQCAFYHIYSYVRHYPTAGSRWQLVAKK